MTATADLAELFYEQQAHMLATVNGFEAGMKQISEGLKEVIVDNGFVDPVTADLRLRQVVHLQSQIRGQLNLLRYSELAQEFVSGYDESAVYGMQVLQALGKSELILSPMLETTLSNLKSFDLAAFEEFGNQTVRAISKELVLNTLVGKKRSEVIKSLDVTLKVGYERAVLYADTAIRSYDRVTTLSVWEEAGIEKFRYFGPVDNVTRPFCRENAGKVKTLPEWRALSNGSTTFGDVYRYLGGPRCRHTLTPEPEA